jgi:hypothetical protein
MAREALNMLIYSNTYDLMSDDENEAKWEVAGLGLSCFVAAKSRALPMKLSRSAATIYESLIIVPGIFDETVSITNTEIAEIASLSSGTVAVGLAQLQDFGMIERKGAKLSQKVQLLTPKWALDYHEARSHIVWHDSESEDKRMTFAQALPIWTAFTAKLGRARN